MDAATLDPGAFDEARVLLVDGRSGAGKTELAARLARRWGENGREPQTLHLDELYPGWDGLAAGSRAVAGVLGTGSYRRYDWFAGGFAERLAIDAGRPLIVEGCGALTVANLAAARRWAGPAGTVRALWLECPPELRRARALGRDGDSYAPHWDRWAAQEEAHYAEHRPWELADQIVRVR
ncbi:hypothetical protein B4915_06735 [Leucobacter massiliensis]|uniref:ATP-binding protein n=1 Tax=Leucobacter massiliensis TaxID=1686285 RepID=A0A2S9QPM8_9MICO|nr:hypothetical protein B4915_06735 [Leucobacter massiliensis]